MSDPGGHMSDPGGHVSDPGGHMSDPGGHMSDPGGHISVTLSVLSLFGPLSVLTSFSLNRYFPKGMLFCVALGFCGVFLMVRR